MSYLALCFVVPSKIRSWFVQAYLVLNDNDVLWRILSRAGRPSDTILMFGLYWIDDAMEESVMQSKPLAMLLMMLAGWINRQQQDVIDYLKEENKILREKLGKKRVILNDDQRRGDTIDPTLAHPMSAITTVLTRSYGKERRFSGFPHPRF